MTASDLLVAFSLKLGKVLPSAAGLVASAWLVMQEDGAGVEEGMAVAGLTGAAE